MHSSCLHLYTELLILPKGGVNKGEDVRSASARESYEEAGILGEIGDLVHQYSYSKSRPEMHTFYALRVTEVLYVWPEMQRSRVWLPVAKALEVHTRLDIMETLRKFSMLIQ